MISYQNRLSSPHVPSCYTKHPFFGSHLWKIKVPYNQLKEEEKPALGL